MNNSLSHKGEEPEKSVLYVVGTPIGNLQDISSRALNILQNVSFVACEDTRQTKKLMNKFEIKNNLISFHKYNSSEKIPRIIKDLNDGKSIALVSDAGMPSICDPGEELIREVKLKKFEVICIPGPSAALTALITSGMPSSRFVFEGFLPRKKIERKKILADISKNERTTILFESPHRLQKLLLELKEYCGGDREIQVSRELTKKFEQNISNNIENIIKFFNGKEIKGEITIVVRGIRNANYLNLDKLDIKEELKLLINAGLSLSAASKYLAKKTNLTKSVIYKLY